MKHGCSCGDPPAGAHLPGRGPRRRRPGWRGPDRRRGRVPRAARAVGVGQVDPPQPDRWPVPPERRAGSGSATSSCRRPATATSTSCGPARVADAAGRRAQPAALLLPPRQRRLRPARSPPARRRRPARPPRGAGLGRHRGPRGRRPIPRARPSASSRPSRSRSLRVRAFCSRTSRPDSSTTAPATGCCRRSTPSTASGARRSCWSPTTVMSRRPASHRHDPRRPDRRRGTQRRGVLRRQCRRLPPAARARPRRPPSGDAGAVAPRRRVLPAGGRGVDRRRSGRDGRRGGATMTGRRRTPRSSRPSVWRYAVATSPRSGTSTSPSPPARCSR